MLPTNKQQDAREKLDAKLTKLIDNLFILWKQTMYPGMDKYFAINSYIPELTARFDRIPPKGEHGERGAWLFVEDTRSSKKTFSVSIAKMLSDLDRERTKGLKR